MSQFIPSVLTGNITLSPAFLVSRGFHELKNKANGSRRHFGSELVVCTLGSGDCPAATQGPLGTLVLGYVLGCSTAAPVLYWGGGDP